MLLSFIVLSEKHLRRFEERYMQADAVEMKRVVEGLPTISAKIRALDTAGYMRADIARFLGKRYQHVWNVLVRARPKTEATQAPCLMPDEPGDVESQRIRLLADGRMVIPAKMRSAMLIDEGGYLTARVVEGELRVLTPKAAVLKLQRRMREEVPEGVSVIDDLIAERRAEAQREDSE
jgi:bifunctional DNA-binding transcriptional regulator/antitoxin component of YhaV-PrlF toxin-antitoxin module